MSKKALEISVYGKVQRVGFRYYVEKGADIYNINGFVKNMADGSVYIEAEGDETDIENFLQYCKKGPEWSRVDNLNVNEIPIAEYRNFKVKY